MGRKGFGAPILILVVLLFCLAIGGVYYFGRLNKQSSPSLGQAAEPTLPPTPSQTPLVCPGENIPGYELATDRFLREETDKKLSAEFALDLRGSGTKEIVKIYQQTIDPAKKIFTRNLPVALRVFSATNGCPKLEFEFGYKVLSANTPSGNEWGIVKVMPNFFGNGKQVLLFEPISTGYGSGFTADLDFLTFDNGAFRIIKGPAVGELSEYKFSGRLYSGQEILVASAIWGESESHFEPHRYKIEAFIWDGKNYINKTLGETAGKYGGVDSTIRIIDDIIKREPEIFENK